LHQQNLGVDTFGVEIECINTLSGSGPSSGMGLGSLLPEAAATKKRKFQIQPIVRSCALRIL
jgi:hypothetical protein